MQTIDLSGFYGTTDKYVHRLPMTPDLLLTEGVKYFAEKAGAYWFMDIVATEFVPKLSEEDYIIFIQVTVDSDNGAVIIGSDGGKGDAPKILHTRTIEYTDLPTNSTFNFILMVDYQGNTLMLPSEY